MHFLADQDVYWITMEWLRKEDYGVVCCGSPPRRWRRSIESFGDCSGNIPKSNCAIFSAWSSRTATGSVAFGRTDRRGIGQTGVASFRDSDK